MMIRIPISLLVLSSVLGTVASQELPQFPGVPVCNDEPAGELPGDYKPTHVTIEEVAGRFALLGQTDIDAYQPETIVVCGGSKGIGRGIACYWASKGKKVISLATTEPGDKKEQPLSFPIPCDDEDKIINIKYDVSKKQSKKKLSRILKKHEVDTIDLLLLISGRDILGSLRDFDMNDLGRALDNNVLGLHQVWRELRPYLNPYLAVVLSASSIAAETRFLGRRYVYHMSKNALADLTLGYAIEEEDVQPHTHYGAIFHGDAATNFGLKTITPKKINADCKDTFKAIGETSNIFLKLHGLSPADIAEDYHQIYAYIAAAEKFSIPRAAIPQTYSIEKTVNNNFPLDKFSFNHRFVPPEVLNAECYGPYWDGVGQALLAGCPDNTTGELLFLCPGFEFLAPTVDPTIDMMCKKKAGKGLRG